MVGDKWPSHGRSFLENEPHVSSSFSTGSLVPDSSPPPPAAALRLLTLFMCLHLHALCDGFAWLVFQVNDRGTWGKTNVQVQQIVEESHSTINLASPPPFQKSEGRVQRGCNDAVSLVGKNWEVGADNDETRILRRLYKPSPVPYTTQLAVPALCHAPFSCHHLTEILEAG